MNELIEHIAEKATREMDQEAFSEDMNIPAEWYHKFAELIVRECVKIGQQTSADIFKMSKKEGDIFEYESHGAEQVVENIKEHFGVEE